MNEEYLDTDWDGAFIDETNSFNKSLDQNTPLPVVSKST